jgi:hypothetical protein
MVKRRDFPVWEIRVRVRVTFQSGSGLAQSWFKISWRLGEDH